MLRRLFTSKKNESPLSPAYVETLKYKTPYFLFSRPQLEDNLKNFKKCFPGAAIHYAMKANSEPAVLQALADLGVGFEVASMYELSLLKKIGVSPEKLIYGTSVKPLAHIKEFAKYGVNVFAFDSLAELEKIASVAKKAKVYCRVSVNDAGSVFKFSEKFGTDQKNVVPMLQRAKELGLHPYGISFHVGSQAGNAKAWANAIENLWSTLEHLSKIGIKIDVLNIGGGYPCTYASTEDEITLAEIAKEALKQYKKLPYRPKLILEPGRGMVASTGIAVGTVIGRVERGIATWLFLDLGVYNGLFETMAYQGSTRYRITSLRPALNVGEQMFALAGPTGDSPDIITREALLPSDIQVGDKLVIHDVGAYSLCVTSRFNGFPKPSVYLI